MHRTHRKPTNLSRALRATALVAVAAALAFAQSAPTLTSLSPSSVPADTDATITLYGTNLSGTDVVLGGQFGTVISNSLCFSGPCPIAYISSSQMTVALGAGLLASPGTLSIQVESGSAASNSLTLTITAPGAPNPVPSIASISPSSANAGGPGFTLTVNGSNFVNGAVVQWNGASRTTNFASATQLTAAIPAGDIATGGRASVTVVNPAPGGGTSGSATFVINPGQPTAQQGNRAPIITWVLPVNVTAGAGGATLTVEGTNFVAGSTVQWNQSSRPTTYLNPNQLQVKLSGADIAAAGSGALDVVTPAPGGGTSDQWAYPITSPGVTTFSAGPSPVGKAPVAAAVDPALGRIYVVHRGLFRDICLNAADCASWPTDVVTVVDQKSGAVLNTIGVGAAVNGVGQGIAVDATRHRVFVTNAGDQTVTVIDGTTNATIATTTVDKDAEGIAVDPAGGIVYVAGDNVTLLDAATGAWMASIPVGGEAWAITVDPFTHLAYALVNTIPQSVVVVDGAARGVRAQVSLPPLVYTYSAIAVDPGSRAYVCDYNSGTISPVDITGASPKVLDSIAGPTYATAVAVDPGSHLLYAVSVAGGAVTVLNSGGAIQKTIPGLQAPVAIALDAGSGRAYAVNSQGGSLSVISTTQLAVTGAIPLGVQAMQIATDGQRVYAANFLSDAVSVVDPSGQRPAASWNTTGGIWSVAVDRNLQQLYAMDGGGSLSVFSTVDGSLKAHLDIGGGRSPTMAVNSATDMVYVAADQVVVIDGKTNQVVTKIAAGSAPTGVAVDEVANRIYVANSVSGTISVIDGASNQVIATWNPKLNNVWRLAVDPALKRLYAAVPPGLIGSFSGLEVMDSSSGAFIAQVPASSAAEDVAVNLNTHHVFVADAGDGSVMIVDGASNTVLGSLVTGTSATGLAVDAASGTVYATDPFDTIIGAFADQASSAPAPVVNSGGVVSAASGTEGLSAGGIVTIYGTNLAGSTVVAPGVPWPTSLGGVSVLVNGIAAPIYFVSPGQVAFEMPWQVLGDSQVSVVIVLNGARSAAQTVKLAADGPDLFSMNQQGTGQGAIQIANTMLLAAPPGAVAGFLSRPARRGVDYLTIYCTGLGDVSPRPESGAPAPASPLAQTVAAPTVTVGGVTAPAPIFAGLSPGFVGLYQINVLVPANAPVGDAVPVVVTVGGLKSNTVTIAVQ